MGFLTFVVVGLFAGVLARAILPGKQPMGLFATTLLGMVGSLLGGTVGSLLSPGGPYFQLSTGNLVTSVLGAIAVLWATLRYRARKHVSA